jgi:ElaB/YqjD/DUF883 family membrane-anchored ribosome-binding protein
MPPKDADMPSRQPLGDDIQKITQHLAHLRGVVEKLAGQLGRTGHHQVQRAQDAAGEALASVETAVRRDPLTAVGIAAGIGLLLGIIIRR